ITNGSAEVVGLMMARVMALPDESFEYARLLGRAFQYLNIIRDVKEDIEMGRVYIPIDEIHKTGFDKLTLTSADENTEAFNKLIHRQIDYYKKWYAEAVNGYKYIPKRYLIAIKTASDMFDLTASIIYADPKVIMKRKVKPNKLTIISKGIQNFITVTLSNQNTSSKEPITDMEKP
ncbi:MAG: squalene/phytoene synthase family protein, partial [Armatimonadota bacterium]